MAKPVDPARKALDDQLTLDDVKAAGKLMDEHYIFLAHQLTTIKIPVQTDTGSLKVRQLQVQTKLEEINKLFADRDYGNFPTDFKVRKNQEMLTQQAELKSIAGYLKTPNVDPVKIHTAAQYRVYQYIARDLRDLYHLAKALAGQYKDQLLGPGMDESAALRSLCPRMAAHIELEKKESWRPGSFLRSVIGA